MTATIQIVLFLLAVLVLVAVVAQRLKTPPSILLVAAGIALALIPGLPPVELAPELVILVLLPPLIYSAGVSMSWREFCFNLRPITLLAFGCVIFTTVVAVTAGSFSVSQAAGTFALIVVGEVLYGIGVGWLSLRLRHWAHNPRVEI